MISASFAWREMIMKTKDFRALLAELGSLTRVQRNALMVALSSQRSAGDVVAVIEAEFAKAPACGHCGSEAFSKWGVATGMKRYMCKKLASAPSTRSPARRWRTCRSARSGWSTPARLSTD
jgi:hypothetical protein